MPRYTDKEYKDFLSSTLDKVRDNFNRDKLIEPVCLVLGDQFYAVSLKEAQSKEAMVLAIKKLSRQVNAYGVIFIDEGYHLIIESNDDPHKYVNDDGSIKDSADKVECVSVMSEYFSQKGQVLTEISYADIIRTDKDNPVLGEFVNIKGAKNDDRFSEFLPELCRKRNLRVN